MRQQNIGCVLPMPVFDLQVSAAAQCSTSRGLMRMALQTNSLIAEDFMGETECALDPWKCSIVSEGYEEEYDKKLASC